MHRAGYMAGEPTRVVSLTDLMVIAEGMAVPGEFRHFVRRRFAGMLDERVLVWDELDHLGMYQAHNEMNVTLPDHDAVPDTEGCGADDDTIAWGPDTTESDAHDAIYVRGEGDGLPHQQLPRVFDQLVRALAERHDALWSQALCDLFNLKSDSRQELSESVAIRMTLGYTRPRDVTMAAGIGSWALTLIVIPSALLSMLAEGFLSSLVASGRPSLGNVRLVIAWDPVARVATADYFHLSGERYMRVPPALFWKSSITNR